MVSEYLKLLLEEVIAHFLFCFAISVKVFWFELKAIAFSFVFAQKTELVLISFQAGQGLMFNQN